MILKKQCPICRYEHTLEVDEDAMYLYKTGRGFVQDIFPDLDSFEREFIKSGYCPKCQEVLFGGPYTGDKIKEV